VLRLWSGSTFVRVRARGFARFQVRPRPARSSARPRDGARRRRVRRDPRERLRRRGGLDDGGSGCASPRVSAFRALGRQPRSRGASSPARKTTTSPPGDACRGDERWAARPPEYLPDELDAYGASSSATPVAVRGRGRLRLGPRGRGRWQPTRTATGPGRPTATPGSPTSAGAGLLPLRALGPLDLLRLYWVPGRTWARLGELGGGGGYVGWCPRLARPAGRAWGHRGYVASRGATGSGILERRAPR